MNLVIFIYFLDTRVSNMSMQIECYRRALNKKWGVSPTQGYAKCTATNTHI